MSKETQAATAAGGGFLADRFRAFRRAGVPLVGVSTSDPAGVLRGVLASLNGKSESAPAVLWDIGRGLGALNVAGGDWLAQALSGQEPRGVTNPAMALDLFQALPESGVAVMLGASRLFQSSDPVAVLSIVQGTWNLRDTLKERGAALVLVGPLGWQFPQELRDDIVSCADVLPDETSLSGLVESLVADSGLAASVLNEGVKARAVDAVSGLSAFAAEQVLALSLNKAGIDLAGLWDRKRAMIEQTPGLSVWRGGETFADLGGLENAKRYFSRPMADSFRPRCVLFIDEIEKVLGGSSGDTSGVSQGFLGTLLEWFVDSGATGSILLGHPGAGKSALAKSFGASLGIPTVKFDLNGMKGSLVGQSEQNLRGALSTVNAIARGRCFVMATSNGVESIPVEMRSRFKRSWFFFDLPTKEEQMPIWALKLKKFGLPADSVLPDCEGWTGREIESCCETAACYSIPLVEAAACVVPVCRSDPGRIEALRRYASGRFLSASSPGVYRFEQVAASGSRRVSV